MSIEETVESKNIIYLGYIKLQLYEYRLNLPKYLFSKQDRKLLDIYSCSRCKEIALESKMCRNCNSLICQECIDSLTNSDQTNSENLILCNACKQVLNVCDIQKITKKGLEVLHVKCPSNNINCYEEFELKNLNNHLEHCKFFEGKAKCSGCGILDFTAKIKQHIEKCKEFLEECKYCTDLFYRKELKIHESNCYKKPRNCKMCTSAIDDENITLHPTKDVCMFNIINDIKDQIESKKFFYLIIDI